jgi:hypothetical protein
MDTGNLVMSKNMAENGATNKSMHGTVARYNFIWLGKKSTRPAILDLDEGPPEEEQPFQIQGTHEAQLVGGGTAGVQNEGISSGK